MLRPDPDIVLERDGITALFSPSEMKIFLRCEYDHPLPVPLTTDDLGLFLRCIKGLGNTDDHTAVSEVPVQCPVFRHSEQDSYFNIEDWLISFSPGHRCFLIDARSCKKTPDLIFDRERVVNWLAWLKLVSSMKKED